MILQFKTIKHIHTFDSTSWAIIPHRINWGEVGIMRRVRGQCRQRMGGKYYRHFFENCMKTMMRMTRNALNDLLTDMSLSVMEAGIREKAGYQSVKKLEVIHGCIMSLIDEAKSHYLSV